VKLKSYDEISMGHTDSLILGNGSSIAVSKSFSYSSLLNIGIQKGFVTESMEEIFDFFDTQDIEFVLSHLWYARKINHYLSIRENKTINSYKEIKEALIKTVLKIHPKPSDVTDDTDKISIFLQKFKKIFSLNYDLLVYWSLQKANEQNRGNRIKDCFYRGMFSDDWTYYEEPRPPVTKSTLVFYPHGNLCLLKTQSKFVTEERKIETADQMLLDEIVDKWKEPKNVPLFISEGMSEQKKNSIESSNYLSLVYYSVLPKAGSGITIYGWSVGEQDDHILKVLKLAKVRKIAMSVHAPTTPDIEEHCYQIKRRLKDNISQDVKVEFFDAESEGCWIY
jgi:hypothetical protein